MIEQVEDKIEPDINVNDTATISSSTTSLSTAKMQNEIIDNLDKNLLKTLLSTSTPSPPTALLSSPIAASTESMITKEVNDTQLNVKKIFYQPDNDTKEKDQELTTQNGQINGDTQIIDDDDRLVIDISDDEREEKRMKRTKGKSMPSLGGGGDVEGIKQSNNLSRTPTKDESTKSPHIRRTPHSQNQLPKSFTYSLETSSTGVSSSVKIDILAPSLFSQTEASSTTNEMSKTQTSPSKHSNISLNDELNLLGHEIDKQMSKKTNEILELTKEFLGNKIDKNEFHSRMEYSGNINMCDFISITKRLTKRQKFEANPNQKEFSKMKHLQFPTSSKDLVNYFESLLPSINGEKFINMIKFYEIIIKEMFNLNKTKILQYLIDFMVKRKNAQLDLLNFNYQINSSPNLKQNAVTSSSKYEIPDSTQNPKNDRRQMRLRDTSYNFVIRSDPIYLTAASTFMTNHRDVISCRVTPNVQMRTFERRPFDNNILKGRRIGRRIVCSEDERIQVQNQNNNSNNNNNNQYQHSIQTRPKTPPKLLPSTQAVTTMATTSAVIMTTKSDATINVMSKPQKIQNSSPILVESDTPPPPPPPLTSMTSQSPPIHKIAKPQIITNQVLQRAFSERAPIITPAIKEIKQKFEFPKLNSDSSAIAIAIRQPPKRRASVKALNFPPSIPDPLAIGQISLSELKALNQNGTEIIPTSILRNTITARRKTIDVDRTTILRSTNPIEVKRINPIPSVTIASSLAPTAFMQEQLKTRNNTQLLMRRRQSCHERILVPSNNPIVTSASNNNNNNSNISKNFLEFYSNYEQSSHEMEIRRNQMQHFQKLHLQQQQQLQQQSALYAQQKRVRFSNENNSEIPRSPQITRAQFASMAQQQQQQHQQQQQQQHQNNQIENHQRLSHYQIAQRSPAKSHPPPSIDYQQYQMYFERELRENGYADRVETLQDRECTTTNHPMELISHVPPERYHQQPEVPQPNIFTSPKPARVPEKSPRIQQQQQPQPQQRTPQMVADEKAKMVAYHQLQSLHRDPATLTAQQHAEHLKQVFQMQQLKASAFVTPQNLYIRAQQQQQQQQQQHQNHQVDEQREREYYQNTQQTIHQNNNAVDEQREREYYQNTQQAIHQQMQAKSPTAQYSSHISPHDVAVQNEYDHEQQSLQRKLKLKSKSSQKYVEPNQMSKPFYNPPHSTYYADPYAVTSSKKVSPIPTAFHPPTERPNDQQQPQPDYRNFMGYRWMMAQHAQAQAQQQQQQQQQQNVAQPSQPARPIPRQAIPPVVYNNNNGKNNPIAPNHLALPNHLQAFQNQQSELYRHFFHPKSY